ncbi:MAG: hypothetical protein COA71_04070 [SAR86 cluster bacterium]|uniref:Uncharacterized protein n=1 Tax=SAR86 cluster bacterium TaxID=2030880 RepID=A0A2A5CGU6_9GAMM|nr:MAG: hypothetical protein COA71_04070 [SAR86 cluster bacterium]
MKIYRRFFNSSLALLLTMGLQTSSFAQIETLTDRKPGDPEVEYPSQEFATSEEHYNYLLEEANGGTQHTMATIPVWDGLWSPGYNSMPAIFLEDGSMAVAMSPGGIVKEGVLTPAYEEQFRQRRAEIAEYGEQLYDRLTTCQYPGTARWLWEPYVKEFANTPAQTWMMNDLMNETRRVYIDAEHINIDGKHSATGDSIGFWDGNKLIIWTKWVNPADYLRGMPLTSNQLELVESWEAVINDEGVRQLITQVTFYDSVGLQVPQSAVYVHTSSPELAAFGARIRNWECATSSNSYQDETGRTFFYLPGDPEYKDARGFTDFPDIPGQSLNPMGQ